MSDIGDIERLLVQPRPLSVRTAVCPIVISATRPFVARRGWHIQTSPGQPKLSLTDFSVPTTTATQEQSSV